MRKFLIGIGTVIVLLLVLVILLPFIVDLNRYQARYLPMIEEGLNRKVALKDIRLMIIPRIGVHLSGFAVLDDPAFSTGPFISLSSLDIGIKWKPLLKKRIEVEEITFKDPVITVIRNSHGVLNTSTLGKQDVQKPQSQSPSLTRTPLLALALLVFDRVLFTNGNIVYHDLSGVKPAENKLQQFNLLLKSVGLGKTAELHMSTVVQPMNLPVKLDGSIGPFKENLDFQSIDLVIAIGKTALTVKGSMHKGDANLTIAAPVINTSDLPAALPLKKPVQATNLQVAMEAKEQRVRVSNFSLNLFGGQITGQAEMATESKSPAFEGKIRVQGLQLKPLMEAVGTDKVSARGTAAAQLDIRGVGFSMAELTDSLAGTGHIEAKDGKIEGINLLKEMFKLLRLAGINHDITDAVVFSIVESDLSIKRGIIAVERSRIDSKDFQATAGGTIEFDQKLNLKAKLSLSEELSRQINGAANITKAVTTGNRVTVPMIITGTLSVPSYALDTDAISAKAKERLNEELKGKVRKLFKELKNR